jgi:hypothetical protein
MRGSLFLFFRASKAIAGDQPSKKRNNPMQTTTTRCIILTLFLLLLPGAALSSNVAYNATVTLNGIFGTGGGEYGNPPLADPSSLVDGIFITPEVKPYNQWNVNSIWWNGNEGPNNYITINLGGLCKITGFTVQADNNDTYRIKYWDAGTTSWKTAWDIPERWDNENSWGLMTRSSNTLPEIFTSQLMFIATSGDNLYAVSEIQAEGSVVPLPSAVWLLGSGLMGLAGLRRFRTS